MGDLDFQNLSTVQSKLQPMPNTVASTTTIAPTTLHTYVTGTLQVATITPPVTGQHLLFLTFVDASPGATVTTGNIATAITPTQNVPCGFLYDPALAKYLAWANNVT